MELFLSAGDPSGDNAAARLIQSIKAQDSGFRFFGLGHSRLAALGQEQLAESNRLAVLGFWEVARQWRFFRRLMYRCVEEIERRRPEAIILVDYPGFNLRLAQRVKKLGIPIIYYISPQVWAWGKRRVSQIRELVDLMLVILPFEEDFFRGHDIPVKFVGHYLLEDIPPEYISSSPPEANRLCLLPGSRPQEVHRMLPTMLETARILNHRYDTKAVVAGLSGVVDYEKMASPYAADGITVEYDDPRRCIFESDLALTASGTVTLETGIIGRPMVVIYRTGFITYQIARRLIALDKIALVNLVAGEKLVPELIQQEASPVRISEELTKFMDDRQRYESVREHLCRVPEMLGGVGASDRAARLILDHLREG
ncbi:MAG: lipid-A-disaccharide synthase [candidate division Zixibacteria bacterium]|nr:lipid-A-disaccharide synthase [candidate division Zixibacteria bacterium]